ncbi:trichohyalin-like isoform X1 [Myripristis murdjan]|uniref:trichohyalin-like isoform X1 n=1 Tax=Myripristis murdjan TaxID=586833 RepID=UPI001175F313|nr:trichohyalin-like isoform X1 [Myripristis murdjan]
MASHVEGSSSEGLQPGDPTSSPGTKPQLGPKPRITPKPFSLQKNTTIRSIHAPKTAPTPATSSKSTSQPNGKLEATGVPKVALATQPPKQNTTQDSKLNSVNIHTKAQPKPAKEDKINLDEKQTPDPRDSPANSSLASRPAALKNDQPDHPTVPDATKPEPVQTPAVTQRNHKASADILTPSEQKEEGEKGGETKTSVTAPPVLPKPQNSGRNISSTASPSDNTSYRWGATRKRLSTELTSKFASGCPPLSSQPATTSTTSTKDDGNKPVTQKPEQKLTASDPVNRERDEDELKEDRTGGSTIQRRISLLLDSSSRPVVAPKKEEPEIFTQTSSTGGVKDRIKNWAVEASTETAGTEKKPKPQPRGPTKSLDSAAAPADPPTVQSKPTKPPVELPVTERPSTQSADQPPKVSLPEQSTETPLETSKDAPSEERSTKAPGEHELNKSTDGGDRLPDTSLRAEEPITDNIPAVSESISLAPKRNSALRRSVRFGVVERDDGGPPEILGSEPESSSDEEEDSGDKAEDEAPVPFPVYKRAGLLQREDGETKTQGKEENLEVEDRKRVEENEQARLLEERRQEEERERERTKQMEEQLREEEKQRKEEEERKKAEEKLREEEMEKERLKEEERKRAEEEWQRERIKEEERERERLREEERQRERKMELMWQRQREEERERARQAEERLRQEEREKERLRMEEEREKERLREEERERERQNEERERERLKEEERLRILEEERKRLEEKQLEEEMEKERQREEERRREEEFERQRLQEEERVRERLREEERERERQMELMWQKQREEERERAKQIEERLRQEERLREEEAEKKRLEEEERLREEERERTRLREEAKAKEIEREQQKDAERQREEQERERRELERKMLQEREEELERERLRQREMERQREEEREKQMEEERKRQLEEERVKEQERERQRQEELERKRTAEIEEKLRLEARRKEEEERERERKREEELKEKLRMEEEERKLEEVRLSNLPKEEDRDRESAAHEAEPNLISFDSEDTSLTPESPSTPTQSYEPAQSKELNDVVYDDFSVPKPLIEVVYDDFSVKPRRWGLQSKASTDPGQTDAAASSVDADVEELVPVEDSPPQRGVSDPQQGEGKPDCPEPEPVPAQEIQVEAEENSEEVEEKEAEREEEEEKEEENEGEEDGKQEEQVKSYVTEEKNVDSEAVTDSKPDQQNGECEQTPPETDSLEPILDQAPEVSPDDVDATLPHTEAELPAFPEISTPLLDTQAQRSRAELGKKRSQRTRPPRSTRPGLTLLSQTEGPAPDWRTCDSTDGNAVTSKQRESDSEEEQPRPKVVCSPPSSSQRVPVFPGLSPSALVAQLKKRAGGAGAGGREEAEVEKDGPSEEVAPSPSQLSRSPRAGSLLAGAARVLPPLGGSDGGTASSPLWLKELKSKKRQSLHNNDS